MRKARENIANRDETEAELTERLLRRPVPTRWWDTAGAPSNAPPPASAKIGDASARRTWIGASANRRKRWSKPTFTRAAVQTAMAEGIDSVLDMVGEAIGGIAFNFYRCSLGRRLRSRYGACQPPSRA
jgi:hypothetical protein